MRDKDSPDLTVDQAEPYRTPAEVAADSTASGGTRGPWLWIAVGLGAAFTVAATFLFVAPSNVVEFGGNRAGPPTEVLAESAVAEPDQSSVEEYVEGFGAERMLSPVPIESIPIEVPSQSAAIPNQSAAIPEP